MQELIEEIKTCNKNCGLREIVCKSFGKLNTFNTFCFYYSENDIKTARFIMIMQNPGQGKNHENKEENKELLNATTANFIEINKKYLIKWLRADNKGFIEPFINKLFLHKLIEYKYSEEDSFQENLFRDFLFTDVVKCRTTTHHINNFVDICFANYLLKELKLIGSNKLIFVFGSRAWESIYHSDAFINKSEHKKEMNKVSQAHGFWFASKMLNSYFIPLAHFSRVQFNKFLRNSYFYYLEDELKKNSEKWTNSLPK